MTVEEFKKSITFPIENKDYIDLYNQFKNKFVEIYKSLNKRLDEEYEDFKNSRKPPKNYAKIYQEIKNWEISIFNPYFNENAISIRSIREFFEIIKEINDNVYELNELEQIFSLCDDFEEKYEERINSKIAKAIQYEKIKDFTNKNKMLQTKKDVTKIAEELKNTKSNKEKENLIKQLPFQTTVENVNEDLKKYLENLDKTIEMSIKIENELKNDLKKVLKGKRSYGSFEKQINEKINNLKAQSILEKDLGRKESIEKEIKLLSESLENVKNAFSSSEVSKVLESQLIKITSGISKEFKEIDSNLIKEFQNALKNKDIEKQGILFKEINNQLKKLEELPEINKELLKEGREELLTLQEMHKKQEEKDKKEAAIKNIEKAKNLEFNENKFNEYVESKNSLKSEKGEKKNLTNIEELAYELTSKGLKKSEEVLKGSQTFGVVSQKASKYKNTIDQQVEKYVTPIIEKVGLLAQKTDEQISKAIKHSSQKVEDTIKLIADKSKPVAKNIDNRVTGFLENKKVSIEPISKNIIQQTIKIPKLSNNATPIEENLNSIAKELGLIAYVQKEEYIDKHKQKEEVNKIEDENYVASAKEELPNYLDNDEDNYNLNFDFDYDRENKENRKTENSRRYKRTSRWKRKLKVKGSRTLRKGKSLVRNIFSKGKNVFKTFSKGRKIASILSKGRSLLNAANIASKAPMLTGATEALAGGTGLAEAGSATLALASNPIGWAVAGAAAMGAIGYGIYKLKYGEDKKLIDELEKQGIVEYNFFGDSKIKNWEAILRLKNEDLKKLVHFNDWDDNTLKTLKVLSKMTPKEREELDAYLQSGDAYFDDGILTLDENAIQIMEKAGQTSLAKKILPFTSKDTQEALKKMITDSKNQKKEKQNIKQQLSPKNTGVNNNIVKKNENQLSADNIRTGKQENNKDIKLKGKTTSKFSFLNWGKKLVETNPLIKVGEDIYDLFSGKSQKEKVKSVNIKKESNLENILESQQDVKKGETPQIMTPIGGGGHTYNTTIINQNVDTMSLIFGIL